MTKNNEQKAPDEIWSILEPSYRDVKTEKPIHNADTNIRYVHENKHPANILCPECEFLAHWNDFEKKYQCDNCDWGYSHKDEQLIRDMCTAMMHVQQMIRVGNEQRTDGCIFETPRFNAAITRANKRLEKFDELGRDNK